MFSNNISKAKHSVAFFFFFTSLDIAQTWKILVEAVPITLRTSVFITAVDVIMSVWNLS